MQDKQKIIVSSNIVHWEIFFELIIINYCPSVNQHKGIEAQELLTTVLLKVNIYNLKSPSYRHTQFDIKMQLLQFNIPNGCTKIIHSRKSCESV